MRSHCNLLLRRDQVAILLTATARRWAVPILIVGGITAVAVFWQLTEVREMRAAASSWQELAQKAERVRDQAKEIQSEAQQLLREVQAIEALAQGWYPTGLLAAIVRAVEEADGRVALLSIEVTESSQGNAESARASRGSSTPPSRKVSLRGVATDSRALATFSQALTRQDGIREVVVDQLMATDRGTEFVLTGRL